MIEPGDADEDRESSRVPRIRSRRKRNLIRGAVAIALVAVIGFPVYNRMTFGTFAWWEPPASIDYCGRQFLRGSTVAEIPADMTLQPATTVFPTWWQVYLMRPRGNGGVDPSIPGLPCTIGLAVRLHDGDYVQYGLSGGP